MSPVGPSTSFSLEGRRAIVTGAGAGIGLAVGQGLAAAGASVVFHSATHHEDARAAADAVQANGGIAHALSGDFSDAETVIAVIDEGIQALGGLDILVNNAGVTRDRPFAETTIETFDALVAINLRATYLATQRALPSLLASGHGSVIVMASVHGMTGYPGHSAYGSTKGALTALARELAVELGPSGVRVNAVAPGPIEVARYHDRPGYATETAGRGVPIGRMGFPDDVVGGVVYLASDAASFVTGHTLVIDGGASVRLSFDPASGALD